MSENTEKFYAVGLRLNKLDAALEENCVYITLKNDMNGASYRLTKDPNDLSPDDKFKRAFLAGQHLKKIGRDNTDNQIDRFAMMFENQDVILAHFLSDVANDEIIGNLEIFEYVKESIVSEKETVSVVKPRGARELIYSRYA